MEEPQKFGKMVSNTQRINVLERRRGELNDLEERVNDLTDAREGFDLVGLLAKFKELERAISLSSNE